MDSAISGSPWLVVMTALVIPLLGIILTAVVSPAVVERIKRGRPTGAQPAPAVVAQQSVVVAQQPAMVAQQSNDAIDLIRDSLGDLQTRVGKLEGLQMQPEPGRSR